VDYYKTGASAAILTSEMLRCVAEGEPVAPVLGGFTDEHGKLGVVMCESSSEADAFHAANHLADRVAVMNVSKRSELQIVVPHPELDYAMVYSVKYACGGGRVFTSTPDRRIRVLDPDVIAAFDRGFEEALASGENHVDLSGWGELGDYEEN
jgi:hypothetical protein